MAHADPIRVKKLFIFHTKTTVPMHPSLPPPMKVNKEGYYSGYYRQLSEETQPEDRYNDREMEINLGLSWHH